MAVLEAGRVAIAARTRAETPDTPVPDVPIEATVTLDIDTVDLLLPTTSVTVGFERSSDGVEWVHVGSTQFVTQGAPQAILDRVLNGEKPSYANNPRLLGQIRGQRIRGFFQSETTLTVGATVRVR